MKRKRGSAKRKPKKDAKATGVSVDPEYHCDANEKNDGDDITVRIKANEKKTDTNSQPLGLDKPAVNDGTVGSAAAKLARAISTSCTNVVNDRAPPLREKIGFKEPKSSVQKPLYHKQELDAAQSVIKKIMKMDAAAPFNAPVDPIALGIPDYFDIIDTPMDFGTIVSKLEKGLEYKNSEDVFKDVQKIWENCIKYNKKGSYILELMKRVKANFMKQWNAAGLHKEKQTVTDENPPDSPPLADSTMRSEEAPYLYPGGSNINSSAYMQRHDAHFSNKRQHQPHSPYSPPSFNPQHMPYQWPGSYHPGQLPPGYHPHGMPPPYNYFTPPHMNGNHLDQNGNPRLNEMSSSMMHSYQAPPSYIHMGHPHPGNWMQQPSSSHVAPSGLQSGMNDYTPGHLHAPHRDSTSTRKKYEHAGGHYQEDSIQVPDHHPSASRKHEKLKSSTHHQNPRTEIGRYSEYAGNIHLPPPTESTVNWVKRGANYPQPPVIDKTSCRSPARINSSPEQSSSMANIEAFRETAADDDFSERKALALRIIEHKEHSSSSKNSHESQPQDITRQKLIDSKRPQPSLPYHNTKPPKKRGRGRGPTRELLLPEGERLSVTINELGQPVGNEAQKLVTYLGTLARNGNFLPLTYSDWRAVPFEKKESMWDKILSKFEIPPVGKDWVMRNLGNRWKDFKSKLKLAHYDTHKTNEERLADCDERVVPEQWAALVALWNTEEAQKISARNRANRMKVKYNHATGSKSFARIREEERAKRPDGKEPTRAELFVMTRMKKSGEPVNEESLKVIMQLREKDQMSPADGNKAGDVLTDIIGPDKKGRIRCLELGPTPDGILRPTRTEAIKMVSEAKTEIKEMKEKMATMEHTCSQMASQMAAMMPMMTAMQKIVTNKNIPLIANNASGASDHALPPQELTRPSPSVGSTRQTRQSSNRLR